MKRYRERIAPHLHIPLQSGSDKILKKMGRPYDRIFFKDVVKKIYKSIPGMTITTDVMVGFPGETGEDFEKTLELVKEIGFSKLHVFKYSPRPETRAFHFNDKVSSYEKTRRSIILRGCGEDIRRDFLEKNTGLILDVAVEKELNGKMASGTSGNYIKVYFKKRSGPEGIRGSIIKVRTEKRYLKGLIGEKAY
jgi:threonylcarbamoyladenosine tRNA methylthiotransferase MtaB